MTEYGEKVYIKWTNLAKIRILSQIAFDLLAEDGILLKQEKKDLACRIHLLLEKYESQ